MKTKHLILIAITTACVSCMENWEEHYYPSQQSRQTLWEQITAREELNDFAQLLQSRGYDKLLDNDQRFTVWAPMGNIDTLLVAGEYMSEEEIVTQVIENHIARSLISVSPIKIDSVKTLNGKQMKLIGSGNHVLFNDMLIEQSNIECSNGILHITQGQVRFNNNIWTYLRQDAELCLLSDFFYSFNRQKFDPDASTLGGVIGGEKVYSDSVFVTTNELWAQMGYLNAEDKSYIMIAPTNDAWEKTVDLFEAFYCYPEGLYEHMGDSIAKRRIVDYLIYAPSEECEYETIVADTVNCSNGMLLKAEEIYLDPYETFVQDIVIEGESDTYLMREPGNCDATNIFVVTGKNELSNNRYMRLIASSPLLKPTVTYALPGALSCSYDIGIVFAPMNLTKNGYSSTIEQKDGRIDVELRDDYLGESYNTTNIIIDGSRIDTVWVAENHRFPYCDYYPGRTEPTESKLTLKITGTVKRSETEKMSRDLYIDCIVLRPRKS